MGERRMCSKTRRRGSVPSGTGIARRSCQYFNQSSIFSRSIRIASEPVRYGADCLALRRFVGRKVFVTIDPDDISHCLAFTADRQGRRLIGRLEANERIAPDANIDDLRASIAKVNSRRKLYTRAGCNTWGRRATYNWCGCTIGLSLQRGERPSSEAGSLLTPA